MFPSPAVPTRRETLAALLFLYLNLTSLVYKNSDPSSSSVIRSSVRRTCEGKRGNTKRSSPSSFSLPSNPNLFQPCFSAFSSPSFLLSPQFSRGSNSSFYPFPRTSALSLLAGALLVNAVPLNSTSTSTFLNFSATSTSLAPAANSTVTVTDNSTFFSEPFYPTPETAGTGTWKVATDKVSFRSHLFSDRSLSDSFLSFSR